MKISSRVKSLATTSLVLATMAMTAFATNPTSKETLVQYVGVGQELYEVVVPAMLTPDGDDAARTGTVSVTDATFPTTKELNITAPESVDVSCDIDGTTKTLTLTFADIKIPGDNEIPVSGSADITVQQIEDALFGTWSGTFTYTISLDEVQTQP